MWFVLQKCVESWGFPWSNPEEKPLPGPISGHWFNHKQEAGVKVPLSLYQWLTSTVVHSHCFRGGHVNKTQELCYSLRVEKNLPKPCRWAAEHWSMKLIIYGNYLFWQCNKDLIAKTLFSQLKYSKGVTAFTVLYLETTKGFLLLLQLKSCCRAFTNMMIWASW